MPKTKTDFATQPVSFYKFICSDENITSCYVGHTINFTKRKSQHKSNCNNEKSKSYNFKIYEIIRANGGWNNWTMIEINSQLCESERHAERVEQDYISELKSDMNTRRAFIGDDMKQYHKQYRQDHKECNAKRDKQYRQDNKEHIFERQKQIIKCECGAEIRYDNLARHIKNKKHSSNIALNK